MNAMPPLEPISMNQALLQIQAERRDIELVWYRDMPLWIYKDDWLYNHIPVERRGIDRSPFQRPRPAHPVGPDMVMLEHVLEHDPAALVFDVGCNYGVQAVRMLRTAAKLNGRIRAQLFDPGLAGKLSVLNCRMNGFDNFDFYYAAVSDTDGYVSVFINEGQTMDNKIINPRPQSLRMPVRAVRLADLLRDADRNRLFFLKVDTQGAEYEVLRGLDDPSWRSRCAAIIEFVPGGLRSRVSPREFLEGLCAEFLVLDVGAVHEYVIEVTGDRAEEVIQRVKKVKPPFTDLLLLGRDLPERDALVTKLKRMY